MNLIKNFAEIFSSSGKMGLISLLLLFSFLVLPLNAQVFKWTDENGKMHFTDSEANIPKKYRQNNLNPYAGKQFQFICDTGQYPESENQLNSLQKKIREINEKINEEENQERKTLEKRQKVQAKKGYTGTAKRMVGDRNRQSQIAGIQNREQDRLAQIDKAAQEGEGDSAKSGLATANEPGNSKKGGNQEKINRLKKSKEKLEADLESGIKKYNCEKMEIPE